MWELDEDSVRQVSLSIIRRRRCLSFLVVVLRLMPLDPPSDGDQVPMLRAMREKTKWIFYILAVTFVGWLVFDVGMGITGRGQSSDVVLKINGDAIHLPQYQAALQGA